MRELLDKHSLQSWSAELDNSLRRFGGCCYQRKTISISRNFLDNSTQIITNTILHEIAHALTPKHHHDKVWKRKAIEIGCTGERCYKSTEVIRPKPKYTATCADCDRVFTRMRKRDICCGFCNTKYSESKKLLFILND